MQRSVLWGLEEQMNQQEIAFKANGHKNRFVASLRAVGSSGDTPIDETIDAEYGSALYLLTSNPAVWEETEKYVSGSGIPFDRILEEAHLSSTEKALVLLAGDLFGFGIASDIHTLCYLNDEDFAVVISALHLRRSRVRFSDFIERA